MIEDLLGACEKGDTARVRALLDDGADVNAVVTFSFNIDGSTKVENAVSPLGRAVESGHGEIVKLLLERGADPNHKDYTGANTLIAAIRSGHGEIARMLLKAGVDPNSYDGLNHASALSLAAGMGDVELVKILLRDASPERRAEAMRSAAFRGQQAIVELLGDTDAPSRDVFESAAMAGNVDVLENLFERHPDSIRHFGGHALNCAANAGKIEAVEFLLSKSVDVNHADTTGWNPIMHAAWQGHAKVAHLLKKHGGDVTRTDSKGMTVLDYASDNPAVLNLVKELS